MRSVVVAAALTAVMLSGRATAQDRLPDDQIAEAVALGKRGVVPIVKVTAFLGDFDIYIEGPIARIATAAQESTRQFKPFEAAQVPPAMAAMVYAVRVRKQPSGRGVPAERVVLQTRGTTGLDGVIQPVSEGRAPLIFSEVLFDRLPEGEFDVVVVTPNGTQRYWVKQADRAKIR